MTKKKKRTSPQRTSGDMPALARVSLVYGCGCGTESQWTLPLPADTTVSGPLILKGARCPVCAAAVVLPPGHYRATTAGLVVQDDPNPGVPEGLDHLAGTPLAVPFVTWLRLQALRQDAVGRLGWAARGDSHAPLGITRDDWVQHLALCNAGPGATEALDQAWAEYEHKAEMAA